mmetsp:Transcript_26480/g.82448  ORF Transcript_26480/g.82448 Transcript_26480/m.82448 type:complete len:760 (+) Transcript_26480:352-2631(+)
MRLVCKASGTNSALLEVEGCPHDTMLQMLSPGEVDWKNIFRLADETGLTPFPATSLRVLTPPPTPAVLGMGRNICVFWDFGIACGITPEVAASVPKQSSIRYVVNWQRDHSRVCDKSKLHHFDCGKTHANPEAHLKGSIVLNQHRITDMDNELNILAAFPRMQANTDYRITLQTVAVRDSNEDYPLQSAESPPAYWFTGLDPPFPLMRIKESNEVTLKMPIATDPAGILKMFKLEAQRVFEGQYEGARTFRRLQRRIGSSSLLANDSIALLKIPADQRFSIRMRCAVDLRPLGARGFFWDTTRTLEVETLPNPPSFLGMAIEASAQSPSLVTSWPESSLAAYEPCAYQMQMYSYKMHAYVTVVTTYDSRTDLCSLQWNYLGSAFPEQCVCQCAEVGVCIGIRLLRAPRGNRVSRKLPVQQAPSTVALLAPFPPHVISLPHSKNLVRISWDGALDITHVPCAMSLFPSKFALEVASVHACSVFPYRSSPALSRTVSNKLSFHTIASSHSAFCITAALLPGRCYFFRLRLKTAHGISTSWPVEIQTRPTTPDAPPTPRGVVAFFVSATGHRAPFLRVSWDKPPCHGSQVNRYLVQVRYSVGYTGWGHWRTLYAGPQASCGDDGTLNKQRIISQYRVKAGSALGWGPFSGTLTINAPNGLAAWGNETSFDRGEPGGIEAQTKGHGVRLVQEHFCLRLPGSPVNRPCKHTRSKHFFLPTSAQGEQSNIYRFVKRRLICHIEETLRHPLALDIAQASILKAVDI